MIEVFDLLGVDSRLPFLSGDLTIFFCASCLLVGEIGYWLNIFFTKNLEQFPSFCSYLLLERELLLLRLNLLRGVRKKEGASVKNELSSSDLKVEEGDWSTFYSQFMKLIYLAL